MNRKLDRALLDVLVKAGAKSRLNELRREMQQLESLVGGGQPQRVARPAVAADRAPRKQKRKLSAAARKATSERMKAYWKAWRKTQ